MSAARSFARNKPIIVLKPGRYAESARAALLPSTALGGDDEVYEAAFKRVGVLRVREVIDLFHAAEVLDSRRLPTGPGVAIVTNAGGLGRWPPTRSPSTADASPSCPRRRWRCSTRRCPPTGATRNPVDVLGDATSDRFVSAVKACLADPGVNGVLLLYTPAGQRAPRRDGDAGRSAASSTRTSR